MKRASIVFLLAVLLSGCAGAASAPAGQPSAAAGSSGSGGASLAEAAGQVTDACTVMPVDLAEKIVPGGAAPQGFPYPPTCSVSNQVQVLEIKVVAGIAVDTVGGAEKIPGIAADAFLERPLEDDAYLTVVLGRNPDAMLYVEVAGHDGKDHTQDAIDVANAIIAKLQ